MTPPDLWISNRFPSRRSLPSIEALGDYKTHGSGIVVEADRLWPNCVFEDGVRFFHPENISIGRNVYIGHDSILHGYYKNKFAIEDDTWIGPQCYFHAAGGITIGTRVGIGPGVKILTSTHEIKHGAGPILNKPLVFAAVQIKDGADIGMGAIIMPGVTIGRGAMIGAGAVVTRDIPDFSVALGVPARVIRTIETGSA